MLSFHTPSGTVYEEQLRSLSGVRASKNQSEFFDRREDSSQKCDREHLSNIEPASTKSGQFSRRAVGGEEQDDLETALVGSVESTVKEELKSYAAVVQKSCIASLAPAKFHAVIKKVSTEEESSYFLQPDRVWVGGGR